MVAIARCGAGAGKGAGSGGSSGRSGRDGGQIAGRSGGGGPSNEPSCVDIASEASGNVASSPCLACLCDVKPNETIRCNSDCWKLAYCVAEAHCDASDSACIVASCADPLGGMEKLAAAGTLARATLFTACSSICFGPREDFDDSSHDF
jgi:hypothetical protein